MGSLPPVPRLRAFLIELQVDLLFEDNYLSGAQQRRR